MTDRPIIFSAPMVRALIAGHKTQTRRLLKLAGRAPDFIGPAGCQNDPTCWGWESPEHGGFITVEGDDKDHLPGWRNGWRDWKGAYAPGDRLYVREAHALVPPTAYRMSKGVEQTVNPNADAHQAAIYRAGFDRSTGGFRWRASIHMPRWASRLTLTVTEVRVQRLQDISEADAMAEGCLPARWDFQTPADHYRDLWNALHGAEAWGANPWVVAVTFTVAHHNIDQAATV
ncbi:MAG: hypothetical protein V4659_04075 [Pseudomonadota bacterium]